MIERPLALTNVAPVFAPIPTQNRVDAVTQRLGDAIALGALPDGAPLPPEPDLAERLGVATATVREALTLLRQESLVVTRRGRNGGSFVRTPAEGPRSALTRRLRNVGQGDLRDLCDHYAAIAGACAALAAERADEEEILSLSESTGLVVRAEGAGARVRAEGAFHVEVATAAQSARLTRAELDLQSEIGFMLWLGHDETTAAAAARSHGLLVQAVQDRRPDDARAVAESHVRDLRDALRVLHRRAQRGDG